MIKEMKLASYEIGFGDEGIAGPLPLLHRRCVRFHGHEALYQDLWSIRVRFSLMQWRYQNEGRISISPRLFILQTKAPASSSSGVKFVPPED